MNADYFARVANASPFTHMWFLGVEIEYVVLWPLIFGLCVWLKKRSVALLIFLGLVSAVMMGFMALQGVEISRLYYGTDTRIFACFFGGAMGLWFANRDDEGEEVSSMRYVILFGALFVPVLACTFLLRGQYLSLYTGGMQLLTLGFCLMIFVLIKDTLFAKWLEFPLLKWVGSHSYEIFLWQYPVLFFVQGC